MPTFKDVRVGTELTLIGGDQLGAADGPWRGFEVEQFQLAIAAEQQVHLANEDVAVLLQRYVHLGLDDPAHFGLVLMKIIQHLRKGGFLGRIADGTHVGKAQEAKGPLEQDADTRFVYRSKAAVESDTMDFLDRLMDEQAEEDHRRARRREVVFAEKLVLPRTRLVDFEVAGEAV